MMKVYEVRKAYVIHDVFCENYEKAKGYEDGKDEIRECYILTDEEERGYSDFHGVYYTNNFYMFKDLKDVIETAKDEGYIYQGNRLINYYDSTIIDIKGVA